MLLYEITVLWINGILVCHMPAELAQQALYILLHLRYSTVKVELDQLMYQILGRFKMASHHGYNCTCMCHVV